MGKIINERILEIVTTLTSPHTVSWQTAIALMQSNAMFAFVSVLSVKLCSIMQILASSIKQRSKTSFYLWDFRCSSVLPIINSVWKRTCRFMRFMRPFCSPPFYNDSNLDHKRCQWNLIFSVIITLVQLGIFRILIGFLPIWNIIFFLPYEANVGIVHCYL